MPHPWDIRLSDITKIVPKVIKILAKAMRVITTPNVRYINITNAIKTPTKIKLQKDFFSDVSED